MRYFISIVAIAFHIISCSHGITQHFPTGKNLTNPAEIIIIRNKWFVCAGQSTTIMLDGLDIAYLRIGEYVSVLVDNNDGTVTDRATGLMWQMTGSSSSLDNRSAKEYVMQLNWQRFAGYADLRMPTIEELASFIKRTRRKGVYIDPVFKGKQTTCWSADTGEGVNQLYSGAWIVDFRQGQILKADYLKTAGISHTGAQGPLRKNDMNYVKAVRSAK